MPTSSACKELAALFVLMDGWIDYDAALSCLCHDVDRPFDKHAFHLSSTHRHADKHNLTSCRALLSINAIELAPRL
jgi:hypothetical protein